MQIVICGNYGAKNLGDELILEGLLATLKSIVPAAKISVMSGNPEETAKSHGVISIPKFPAGIHSFLKNTFGGSHKTDEALKNCDYFILGGGGLFNNLNFKANIIWAIQAFKAYKYGKKVIMYGQSVGPLSSLGQFLVKKVFSKATFIAVRDEDSATELRKLGIKQEIVVMPDLAFRILEPKNTVQTESQIAEALPTVIIALRNLSNTPERFFQAVTTLANWLISDRNCRLKFINFQRGPEGDHLAHEKIIAGIADQNKVTYIPNISTTKELLKHFNSATFVLGMRLHSIICAIKTCKPFIAINYSQKVESLLKDCKLTEYLVSQNDLNGENLKNFFILLNDKKQKISEDLAKINQDNLQKHLVIEQQLKEHLA